MQNYFPTKIAKGAAFCNRTEELARLKRNIELTNPVLIMSPRRYGKTSLALRAIESMEHPFVHIDFYKSFSEQDVERIILNGIGELLAKIEKTPKKLLKIASEFFSNLHVILSTETNSIKLDFNKRQKDPKDNILEALKNLEKLAKKIKKKVILYMDEFQALGQATPDHGIEAVLREVAQQSDYVLFIFTGSDRHLINDMFNDKKRPFFNLCDIILLNRISLKNYTQYIKKVSVKCWGCNINDASLAAIFNCTDRHPFYLNKLCSMLGHKGKITPRLIKHEWDTFVDESRSPIERELSLLTLNQRKLLTFIALDEACHEPFSKDYLQRLSISSSSAARAMKVLLERDYIIIENKKTYTVLDPLLRSVLTSSRTQ